MLGHLKRLSKQVLIYGLGDAVTRMTGLILLPVYTRFLRPEDYGQLALTLLISTVVSLILELGLRSAFFRFYFQNEGTRDRRRLVGTTLVFLLASSAAILTSIMLFLDSFGATLFRSPAMLPLVRIALFGTFFDLGSVIPLAIFRAEQRAIRYAGLSLARFLIGATLSIVAVVVLHWGVVGIIYANLLTSALFFVICMSQTLRLVEWAVDFSLLKRLLAFGLPLMPATLAGWALTFSDRFFLERYTDLAQVGLYSIAYSIAGILNMMMGWFNTAWLPYCYSVADEPDVRTFYARIFTYALSLFTLLGLGLSVCATAVLQLFATPAYYGAAKVVALLALSYLFYEASYLISFGLDLTGKTSYYTLIVGVAALVNLVLNFLLIPRFGMVGAATSTALSYMVLPLIAFVIVRRFYAVPYERKRLFKLAVTSIGIYLLTLALKTNRLWLDLGIAFVLLLAWAGLLYRWKFFTDKEFAAVLTARHSILQACQGKLRYVLSKVW
jgi:O-antigen/teichoic acid export membrane protein